MATLINDPHIQILLMLLGGLVAMLLATLVIGQSLPSHAEPGSRAWRQWLPIAAAAMVAAYLGEAGAGVSIVLSTSVALLSTVGGFAAMSGPAMGPSVRAARVWIFLPVPVVLSFILGFRGDLRLMDALLLLAQGLMAWLIWREPRAVGAAANRQPATDARGAMLLGLAAIGLAVVGAWAATRGSQRFYAMDQRYPVSAVASTLVSIVLAIPVITSSTQQAAAGRSVAAHLTHTAIVLLNLGLLLPAVIVVAVLRQASGADHIVEALLTRAAVYPGVAWRISAVTLLVLSLAYVGLGTGRLRFDRALATGMILAYCLYLLTIIASTERRP